MKIPIRRNSCLMVMFGLLLTSTVYSQEPLPETISDMPVQTAEQANSTVVLELYENQDLPMGKGFSVFIDGWSPNDQARLSAIGPDEEQVELLLPGESLPVDGEGHVEFSVPYDHNKFYPGQWVLVVEGASGTHGHYFTVP